MTEIEVPPEPEVCVVPPDGVVVFHHGVSALYRDCYFPPNTSFRLYYETGAPPMDTDQPPPAAPAPATTPTIEVPEPAPAIDPAALQQMAGDNPMVAVALAAIAVLGGGAAWKHYAKVSEQKHEQKMKQMELQSQMPTTQPPPCQAADAATRAQLAALEGRVIAAEKKAASVSMPDFDADELEARIAKLEKAQKAKGKAK